MLARWRASSDAITWLTGGVLTIVWLLVYTLTVSPGVNFIDSGELVTALHEPGITHPPGYPLYTLLGYVVSNVLGGEVAWRVNMISAFWAAMGVGAMFFLVVQAVGNTTWLRDRRAAEHEAARVRKPRRQSAADAEAPGVPEQPMLKIFTLVGAVAAASLLGASETFWSRAVQAKLYTLHYFLVILMFVLVLGFRWAYERGADGAARRWIVALAVTAGLALTNHPTTAVTLPAIAFLAVWGRDWRARLGAALRRWWLVVPAFVVPLLLYLYLPLRSVQGPVMNWGSPDNWPDFWRHVSGWQYRTYFLSDLEKNTTSVQQFISGQWGRDSLAAVSWLVLLVSLLGAALLARRNRVLLAATVIEALLTLAFVLGYGSTELEVYLVPLYPMLLLWLGTAAPNLVMRGPSQEDRRETGTFTARRAALPLIGAVSVLAVAAFIGQLPRQNHSSDHLAEGFVRNAFSTMEKDSIVITDNWELFAAPSYYMQIIKNVRPDIVLVDKLLLKYPWYLGQLEKRYPWLVKNSQDIVDPYRVEQHKWVNGEPYDSVKINELYQSLLNSFIERNIGQHPAYVLFNNPDSDVSTKFTRQKSGVAYRLFAQPLPANALPPMPTYDLRGYTFDQAPLDEWGCLAAQYYLQAYQITGQAYEQAGLGEQTVPMQQPFQDLQSSLAGRCVIRTQAAQP